MKNILLKIRLKIQRKLNPNKFKKIQSGFLKGKLWKIGIPDSRYIIGNYEPELSKIIFNETQLGKQFVDIGANAGYFSLLASQYSNKKVISIEPMPENVQFLNEHIKMNKINNIEVLPIAISDKNGEIEFSNSDNLSANTYKKESVMFKGEGIKVQTISLQELAERNSLDSNCFIKIDVEGAEFDVLEGGKDFLKKHHPNLMVATHDCHLAGVKEKCIQILTELGYTTTPIKEEKEILGQEDFYCVFDKIKDKR